MAPAAQEHEQILVMCYAPRGKTSYITQLMKNTDVIHANDANTEGLNIVRGNLHRLVVTNTLISHYHGHQFPQGRASFDLVLLSAPCSGTGVSFKDPDVKMDKDEKDMLHCACVQKELLLSTIDAVNTDSKPRGYLVYRTCSIMVKENDWMADFAF